MKKRSLAIPFASNRISNLVRQIIEKTKYKRVIAANIAIFALVLNIATGRSHAFDYQATGNATLDATQAQLPSQTEYAFQFPVVNPTGVSQRYSRFHPGVDIRAPKGTNVVTVSQGVVIEVKYLKSGYGHYVRVAHAGTMSSLYAHLDKVNVTVGQKLEKGQDLGTVGTTGWTTGPHLHFEIVEGIKTLNPGIVLTI